MLLMFENVCHGLSGSGSRRSFTNSDYRASGHGDTSAVASVRGRRRPVDHKLTGRLDCLKDSARQRTNSGNFCSNVSMLCLVIFSHGHAGRLPPTHTHQL